MLVCAILVMQARESFGRVIKVFPAPGSIHKAIKAALAGDTLLIQKGYYKEHDITIQKRLILIGQGFPVIDAENRYQAFIIGSDSVILRGLQIQNVGKASMTDMAGIKMINASHVTIENNRLINNTFGVYLQSSTRLQ